MQHPPQMPIQISLLLNLSLMSIIFPHADLILLISMGAHQLLREFAPHQRADLTRGLFLGDALARLSVPDADEAVFGAAAAGEEVLLGGAPGESFDGGRVAFEFELAGLAFDVPDAEGVVVGAGSELSAVGGPFEAADFFAVGTELADGSFDAEVVHLDVGVLAAGGDEVVVPGEGGDAVSVIVGDLSDELLGFDVVDEHSAVFHAEADQPAVLVPGEG